MDLKLSTHEQEELNKASSAFNLDSYTKTLTLKYYLEYRHKVGQIYLEKLPLIINCAILAASKSQVLTTVKGETIRGIGISITQLMRGFTGLNNTVFNFDEFLVVLKEFIGTVSLSNEVTAELRGIIEKFAFSYTFFIKYSNIFKQLELKETSHEGEEYLKYLKNFGWMIYINAKSTILQHQTELVESFFLLTATLAHMLYYLPSHIPIHFFEKNDKAYTTKKKNEQAILEGLQELLRFSNSGCEDILLHYKSLQEYLHKLTEADILKSSVPKSFEGMYDTKFMYANFSKLESYYQKRLNHEDLDERFFIRERKPYTPGKFTPFARQGAANKIGMNFNAPSKANNPNDQSQVPKKPFNSHRMLNYEVSEQVTMRTNLSEIKFANRSIPASPYTRLLPATPMTRALEMYNWLSEKTRVKKGPLGLTVGIEKCLANYSDKLKEGILTRVNFLVEKVLTADKEKIENLKNPLYQKKIKDKQTQVVNLYLKVLEDLLIQEEKKVKDSETFEILKSDNFHQALIACSIETVFFVNNSSSVSFVRVLDLCEIEAFDFWRIIGSFAKFDPQMPYPIKKHLYDIELKILMYLAWKKNSVVHKVVKKISDCANSGIGSDRCPRIPELNESPRSSISSESNQDITKSFDHRLNLTSDIRSCASTTVFLESSSKKDSKAKDEHSTKDNMNYYHELFFKRVLHFTALQVYQLCDLLHLGEKAAEQVWGVMKYILSSETNLLIDRHIEQLILCSVYGVCKIFNQPLKFQEIISKYQELPSFNKNEFLEIIHQVRLDDGEKADLIKFYNTTFISHTRGFLFSMLPDRAQIEIKSATPMIKKPLVQALVMESPLRDSLPQYMIQYAGLSAHNKKKSPLLKFTGASPASAMQILGDITSKAHDSSNHLVSKRQINFDEANEGINMDSNARKLKYPHMGMDKIVEQVTEDTEMDSSKKAKRNMFGTSNQANAVKKTINFDEMHRNSPKPNAQAGISFTQMVQTKSQVMFQSMRAAKINLENIPPSQNLSTGNTSLQSQQGNSPTETTNERSSGLGRIFRKADTVTPEFKN